MMATHIEAEKMAGGVGFSGGGFRLGIEGGGVMVMSVARIDVEVG